MNEAGYHIAALIVKRLKQELSDTERQTLDAWLAESPAHQDLLNRLTEEQLLQEDITQMARIDTSAARGRLVSTLFPQKETRTGNRRWYMAAAAVLLLMLGMAAYRWLLPTPAAPLADKIMPGSNKVVLTLADGSTIPLDSTGSKMMRQGGISIYQHSGSLQYHAGSAGTAGNNMLTTPRGGQFLVVLPDGTRVWLNSASSLKYPTAFEGKERQVTLTGQAFFEVAANPGQPFRVRANNMEVEALGTSFDIMAYADEKTLNATLVDGAVRVTAGNGNIVLKPGQQASLLDGQQTLAVKEVDVNRVIAWKSGLFVFSKTDIATILREIARWYDVEIINNAGSSARLFGGSISRGKDLRTVLNLLEAGGDLHFRIDGRKVIMTKK